MNLLLATFGVGVASAVIPVINIEASAAGIAALGTTFGIWPVSMAAAAGQTVGKALWYELGHSSMNWRYIRKTMESPQWQRQYDNVKARIDHRPWLGVSLLFCSASLGIPPLAIMAVLAGQLDFHRVWFYVTTFAGRTLRFAGVLAGVSLLSHSGLFH